MPPTPAGVSKGQCNAENSVKCSESPPPRHPSPSLERNTMKYISQTRHLSSGGHWSALPGIKAARSPPRSRKRGPHELIVIPGAIASKFNSLNETWVRKGPGTEPCTVHLSHIQLAKLFRPQGYLPQTDDKIWSLKWDSLWRNAVASITSTIIAEGPATTSRHLLVTVPASRHPNVRCHHIQTFAQHHSWHSCALRGQLPESPSVSTPMQLLGSEAAATLPEGKSEQKTRFQPCCSHYSSPTACEKFPAFKKMIPAEFYCLKLLIKHALKES